MENKLLKTLNFGGGDTYDLAPDWKNVQNKPFETIGSDTLKWNGNTDGMYCVNDKIWLISDAVPTDDELKKGGNVRFTLIEEGVTNSEVIGLTAENIVTDIMGVSLQFSAICAEPGVTESIIAIIVKEPFCIENFDYGYGAETCNFEKTGIYLVAHQESVSEIKEFNLTLNGYTGFNKKEVLKNEYLGILDTIEGTNTLTWDGNVDGRFSLDISNIVGNAETPEGALIAVKISDDIPTLEQLNEGVSATSTQINEGTERKEEPYVLGDFAIYEDFPGMYVPTTVNGESQSNILMSVITNDICNPENGVVVLEKGVYVTKYDYNKILEIDSILFASSLTFNGYNEFGKKEVIKEEYLPPMEGMTVKRREFTSHADLHSFLSENCENVLKAMLRFLYEEAGTVYIEDMVYTSVSKLDYGDSYSFALSKNEYNFGFDSSTTPDLYFTAGRIEVKENGGHFSHGNYWLKHSADTGFTYEADEDATSMNFDDEILASMGGRYIIFYAD